MILLDLGLLRTRVRFPPPPPELFFAAGSTHHCRPFLFSIRCFSLHSASIVTTYLISFATSDTELPSSPHLCCLLVALLDVLPRTPASAPRRRPGTLWVVPLNATRYEKGPKDALRQPSSFFLPFSLTFAPAMLIVFTELCSGRP